MKPCIKGLKTASDYQRCRKIVTSLQWGINIVGATSSNTPNSLLFISSLSNCVTTNHPVEHIAARRSDSARVIKEQFMGLSHSDGGGRHAEKSTSSVKRCQVSADSAYTAMWITLALPIQGREKNPKTNRGVFQTRTKRVNTVNGNFNRGGSVSGVFYKAGTHSHVKIWSVKWKRERAAFWYSADRKSFSQHAHGLHR